MSSEREMRQRRIREMRRRQLKRRIAGTMAVFALMFVGVLVVRAVGANRDVEITLKADDQSILQDEKVPELTASASCEEKSKKKVLDKQSDYTVNDLLKELKSGSDYSLKCDADGTKEGKFPIKLSLSDALNKKLQNDWDGKVNITVSEGYLKVKNKIGTWKGDKFEKYDGSYVVDDFVDSKGKTYYFGDDGKKVTGWQEIVGKKYHFTKKGVLEKSGWKKEKDR